MTTVPANALESQFEAGLLGLSLLRSWPFADRETVERELAAIAAIAGDRHEFALDRLDLDAGYDGSIDLALCCLALTHCPSVGEPLRDLARTLRPGGRLVLSDVHPVAVVTGAHAFFHREDRSRAVIRNEVHWHSAYLEAFEEAGLAVRHCLEPAFTPAILEAFLAKGSTPTLRALIGLPYVLVWECERG